MGDRPSQDYECQNRGCPNGCGSTFSSAPSDWFVERGLSLPRNCPDCRAWIKSQESAGDRGRKCTACDYQMRLPVRYRISYHKRVGVWEDPSQCRQCERGEAPPKGALDFPEDDTPMRPSKKAGHDFTKLWVKMPVQARVLVTDLARYQYKLKEKQSDGSRILVTRQVHVERHMPGSPHSTVGEIIDGKLKHATGLIGSEASHPQELLESVRDMLLEADQVWMREVDVGGGRIKRLTLLDNDHVEVTIIDEHPSGEGYILVTTYDGVTIEKAINDHNK